MEKSINAIDNGKKSKIRLIIGIVCAVLLLLLVSFSVYWLIALRVDRNLIGREAVIRRVVMDSEKSENGYISLPYNRDSEKYSFINILVDFNQDGKFAAYQVQGKTQEEWVVKNIYPRVVSAEGNSFGFALRDTDIDKRQDFSAVVVLSKKNLAAWNGRVIRGSAWQTLKVKAVDSEDISPLYSPQSDKEGGIVEIIRPAAVQAGTINEVPDLPSDQPPATATLEEELEAELRKSIINSSNTLTQTPTNSAETKEPTVESLGKDFSVFHGEVPDILQGKNECVPTSTANSLLWLAKKYKFTDKMPASDAALINELKTDLKWAEDGVDTSTDYLPGKKAFTDRHGILIETHAVSAKEYDLNIVAKIYQELKKGQDVEVSLAYWEKKADGTWEKIGGHMVTAVGARGTKDGQTLDIHDPLSPGPSKLDIYNIKGTRVVGYKYQADTVTYIRAAYAESPITPPVINAPVVNSGIPPAVNAVTNTGLSNAAQTNTAITNSGATATNTATTPVFTGSYETETLDNNIFYFNVMIKPEELAGQTINGIKVCIIDFPAQPYYFDVNLNQGGWSSQGSNDWQGKIDSHYVIFSGSDLMTPGFKTIGSMFFTQAFALDVAFKVTLLNNGLPVANLQIQP